MDLKNKRLAIMILVGAALFLMTLYEYGYRGVIEKLSETKEEREIKIKDIDKYTSLIGQKEGLEKELTSLKEQLKEEEAKLSDWQGPALAAANLQSIIKEIINTSGGSITTERVNKSEDKGNLKIVSIGMDVLVPDTSVLTSILYSIESRSPYIKITNLDMRVNDLKAPREMTVRIDVASLMRGK